MGIEVHRVLSEDMKIDKIDGKPALDVMTTAIPRLLTVESISDFLSRMEDRNDFHLRWLFHLDQYPGLERNWNANLKQAAIMSDSFDDALLFASKRNAGFEGSIRRLVMEVKRDMLWIEDDHSWHHSFRLGDIIKAIKKQKASGFNFAHQRARVGSIIPTYWTYEMVTFLLENWPRKRKFVEWVLKFRVFDGGGFKYARIRSLPRKGMSQEIGREWLYSRGYTVNHEGIPLDPELSTMNKRKKLLVEEVNTGERWRKDEN